MISKGNVSTDNTGQTVESAPVYVYVPTEALPFLLDFEWPKPGMSMGLHIRPRFASCQFRRFRRVFGWGSLIDDGVSLAISMITAHKPFFVSSTNDEYPLLLDRRRCSCIWHNSQPLFLKVIS